MKWLKNFFRRRALNAHEMAILAASAFQPNPVRILRHGRILSDHEEEVLAKGTILTEAERNLIDGDRAEVLRAMLTPEQCALIEALEKPDRFLPDVTFEQTEADALESMFKSPLWAKLDVALINWCQQQAQRAIQADAAQMVAAGKFAHGCRAGVEMTKTISRLAAAKRSETEDPDAPTAATGLEQHQP